MTTLPALIWEGGTDAAVVEVPRPETREGWSRVRVGYTGLCGSDLHILAGEHIRARPGTVIGHEFVGTLDEPAAGLPAGTPVFVNPMVHCGVCDACARGLVHICRSLTSVGIDYPGGACPEVVVPDYGLYPLPPGMRLVDAALVEPLSVGVRAVRRGEVRLGDRVHVIGAGPIGCIVGLLAGMAGAVEVTVSEPSAFRREQAAALGLTVVEGGAAPTADVVFDATGHPAAAPEITSWSRPSGRIVLVGAYPPAPQPTALLSIMFAELTLVGTRIYTRQDILAAIELIASGRVDVSRFVTEVVPLRDAAKAVERLRAGTAMKLLLDPESA
ncbi:alcohol dehydrogenase catalytic domain-containing protein [Actinoallomurus acanthiterrae]